MKKFLIALAFLFGFTSVSHAQSIGYVVSSCGSITYTPGFNNYQTIDANGNFCSAVTAVPSGQSGGMLTNSSGGSSTLTTPSTTKELYIGYLSNTDTVAHYLWVINTSSAPVNGTFTAGIGSGQVEDCLVVNPGTSGSVGGITFGKPYTVQPYLANSTTACGASSNTLTLSTNGFMSILAK